MTHISNLQIRHLLLLIARGCSILFQGLFIKFYLTFDNIKYHANLMFLMPFYGFFSITVIELDKFYMNVGYQKITNWVFSLKPFFDLEKLIEPSRSHLLCAGTY